MLVELQRLIVPLLLAFAKNAITFSMEDALVDQIVDGRARFEGRVKLNECIRPECSVGEALFNGASNSFVIDSDKAAGIAAIVTGEPLAQIEDIHGTLSTVYKQSESKYQEFRLANKLTNLSSYSEFREYFLTTDGANDNHRMVSLFYGFTLNFSAFLIRPNVFEYIACNLVQSSFKCAVHSSSRTSYISISSDTM